MTMIDAKGGEVQEEDEEWHATEQFRLEVEGWRKNLAAP